MPRTGGSLADLLVAVASFPGPAVGFAKRAPAVFGTGEEESMINIISTQARVDKITGPYKVFSNLLKGLDRIGYPYVVNRALDSTKRLWIHDDVVALRYMRRSKAYKVVGPNLFVMPRDIPEGIELDGVLYLHPCEWAVRLWKKVGFDACPIAFWPVGIDTERFRPSPVPWNERKVMVYHKQRDSQELVVILDALRDLKLSYRLVLYGHYTERDYKELLAKTSFVIWHGPHESQGIALQEAMACDIPILVCDATSLLQQVPCMFDDSLTDFPVTAVPYFDDTCGIKITDLSELLAALERMVDERGFFHPREYVLRNLSLEGQARAFVELWERGGFTLEDGVRETTLKSQVWRQPFSVKISGIFRRLA